MNARILIIALVAAIFGGVVGVLGFVWFVGGDGAASEPISAPTLDINAVATLNPEQAFAAVTQVAALSTQVTDLELTLSALNTTLENPQAAAQAATEVTAATSEPQPTVVPTELPPAAPERILYRIDPANSQATFHLQEDLRGVRTDVIGTTTEVAGDIIIDFTNPAASQLGTIRINARTLATDNETRNRALRSQILQTANPEYEFVEFVPTALNNLPASVVIGQAYTFEIVGNLTIVGRTNEVKFTAQVTPESATRLVGTATTVVQYANWGISIPSVQSVANVTEDVTLTIDFVAGPAETG